MSNLLDLPLLVRDSSVQIGIVATTLPQLSVTLGTNGDGCHLVCDVLETASGRLQVALADVVMVWVDVGANRGVLLGRVSTPGNDLPGFRPRSAERGLVLESDGEIVIRNKNAKILLTAAGEVEVVGVGFSARCQRLVRLLAPLIKLN